MLNKGYNLGMVYVKKEERRAQLEKRFKEKAKDRLEEYSLLGQYSNKDTKTLFQHKVCGNRFMMTPHNFLAGHGCPKCAQKSKAAKLAEQKPSAFKKFLATNNDYEVLSPYVNKFTSIKLRHKKCGREFEIEPYEAPRMLRSISGTICPYCVNEAKRLRFQYTLEQANARLKKVNPEYEFITYNGAKEDAEVRHKVCGEVFTQSAKYLLLGDGHCPKCTTHVSRGEREVYGWVKQYVPDAIQSYHGIDQVWEVDIYCPAEKVAIQFNGHYWHGEQKQPNHQFHYEQSKYCQAEGIRLIHVWEYEWKNPRQQAVLKNIILGALHKLPERYYARECEVKRYDKDCPRWTELNQFFAQNNIQGNRGGSVVFTLEKNNRILMAYKFGRPSGGKAKQKYEYEMVRGASAPGVQVIGGATRLWKHFVKEMQPKSAIYYVDYNYFDGCSVEKLGGKYLGHTNSYKNYWVKEGLVKNREPKKHQLIKQLEAKGEVYKIWNAGVLAYAFSWA